ncbi:MAG TPA: nuclear transport factor 2 family protein [Terriglobales bacterium]|nr:nuclear transport factor 2 family protein [Terriglobales bacterium]
MKAALAGLCVGLGLAAGATLARPHQTPDSGPAQAAVMQVEQRWLAHEDDADVVGPILAPDFVHVLAQGMITRAQHLAYLRSHPPHSGARRFEQLRVRVYGNTAVATGIVLTTLKQGAVRRSLFTDVFVRRQGKWQAVNAQETPAAGRS